MNPDVDDRLDPFANSRQIREIAEDFDIPVFDFPEILKSHPNPISLSYPVGQHLTTEGQRLLGDFVGNELIRAGLFPDEFRR